MTTLDIITGVVCGVTCVAVVLWILLETWKEIRESKKKLNNTGIDPTQRLD